MVRLLPSLPSLGSLQVLHVRANDAELQAAPCRWEKIDASPAWQVGAFDGLAVAYGLIAIVALVSAGFHSSSCTPGAVWRRWATAACLCYEMGSVIQLLARFGWMFAQKLSTPLPLAGPNHPHTAACAGVWVDHAEGVPPAQLYRVRRACGGVCVPAGSAGHRLHAGARFPARPARQGARATHILRAVEGGSPTCNLVLG